MPVFGCRHLEMYPYWIRLWLKFDIYLCCSDRQSVYRVVIPYAVFRIVMVNSVLLTFFLYFSTYSYLL
jgi:hypothetical protein